MVKSSYGRMAAWLALPACLALTLVLKEGPSAWSVSQARPWGMPVAAFVFFIGLAHAGTFVSALLLLLGKSWRSPLAMPAEQATLAALAAAILYPLLHLGSPMGAWLALPQWEARGIGAQPRSPLLWDMAAIGAYAFLSLGFYALHRLGQAGEAKRARLRAMAFVLVPLVVCVHSIVSLDFATARVKGWAFAWFPLYFLAGAIYSGLAWLLLAADPRTGLARQRLKEMVLGFSWLLGACWFLLGLNGEGVGLGIWMLGFGLPQLLWLPWAGRSRGLRALVGSGVLAALLWERVLLVLPRGWMPGLMDLGWLCLGGLVFCLVMVLLQALPVHASDRLPMRPLGKRTLLWALMGGGGVALALPEVGVLWQQRFGRISVVGLMGGEGWALLPLLVPVALAGAGTLLMCRAPLGWNKGACPYALAAFVLGGFLAGGAAYLPPAWEERPRAEQTGPRWPAEGPPDIRASGPRSTGELWQSYCQICHGPTNNEKMPMRRHYPYALKARGEAWDAMGEDSLVRVVLEGRKFMNPYAQRLQKEEALRLVRWMREQTRRREEQEHE